MDLSQLAAAFGPIQDRMKDTEAERATARLEGRAGGGAVSVVLRGDLTVEAVRIAPAAATAIGDDPSMLEDLVAAAVGDALRAYRSRFGLTAEEQMKQLMGGADLGSLLGPLLGR